MLSFFLNPLMLIGLAGIALPVVAHLLSRRKYDVVEWGAMQFLDVSRKTKRKMKLEELLLLLVRILVIALIAFALARPWISSGFLTGYQSGGSRDVVLVIDGSNSMSRSDGMTSLHEKAKRRALEFLKTLQPGDTAAVIDARDQSVRIIASPLQNLDVVAAAIAEIPNAAGAGHLREACEDAVGILGRCSNGNREVVVLTDRQRVGWDVENAASWSRFDEVLNFPAVKPKVWVVDVSSNIAEVSRNIEVGRLNFSRDLTVPDFPVRFEVSIRNTSASKVSVPVSVSIDGQQLAAMNGQIEIDANSNAVFSRSVQLTNQGTHIVTVQADLPGDSIPADNTSSAALQVQSAIPVLMVESSNTLRLGSQDTFFAKMALNASENKSPWILATVVKANDLTIPMLKDAAAFVLANVDDIPTEILSALKAEVADGKGLFVTLGSRTSTDSFQKVYLDSGLFPSITLDRIRSSDPKSPITIAPYSIEAPWLARFRERQGASFLTANFEKWWLINRSQPQNDDSPPLPAETTPTNTTANDDEATVENVSDPQEADAESTALQAIAILETGDPLLLQGRYGRGALLLMTSTLDAAWNSLPSEPDYVPFLHEALIQMASSRIVRNVEFGQPLQTVITQDEPLSGQSSSGFLTPSGSFVETAGMFADGESTYQHLETTLPGVYELKQAEDGETLDAFVVNYDHSEHAPESRTVEDNERLTVNSRLKFVDSIQTLSEQMYRDESRSELWGLLLWVFLGLLTFEVWMTRRMIQKGYADTHTV